MDPLARVAGLTQPIRRALYRFVASRPRGVTRESAAEATALSRSTASYHLDKLVEHGLLRARYERLTGRQGPGAGRPAKIYEPFDEAIEVSVPPRDYETVAELLAQAIERDSSNARVALLEVGREYGRNVSRSAVRSQDLSGAGCETLTALLAARGYEPEEDNGAVTLRNCPFDALAATHRDLICAMNLAILRGVIESLDIAFDAVLAPADRQCCVAITSHEPPRPTSPKQRRHLPEQSGEIA